MYWGGTRNDLHQKHKGTLKAANSGKVPEKAQLEMGEVEKKMPRL
jgi:hypothetical protein